MSAHKMHHSPELLQAMKTHGLVIETPSQLSDCFRFGWTAATDLSQAAVAAALEAAAVIAETHQVYQAHVCAARIRALITPAQHDALAAHGAAEVAKARADQARDAALVEACGERYNEMMSRVAYDLVSVGNRHQRRAHEAKFRKANK